MANIRVGAATRNSMLDSIATKIDAGAGAGTIKIYTGTQPADASVAITSQVLLGTLTFTDPCAGAASGGVLTFSSITQDTSADATGTATWARVQDSNGNVIFDCDVSTAGATINLNTVSIVAGGALQITSFTITHGAS